MASHGQPRLIQQLKLPRCPHCSVAQPVLALIWGLLATEAHDGSNRRNWAGYRCTTCGGLILVASASPEGPVTEMYPASTDLDENIPDPAREFLKQSIESLHAPAGAVMLAASAVGAMLKAKGHKKGSLHSRIEKAAKNHLITDEMRVWAHEIRIDANEPRHADEKKPIPTDEAARKTIEFARALAEFLFVLPARVKRGRGTAAAQPQPAAPTQVPDKTT